MNHDKPLGDLEVIRCNPLVFNHYNGLYYIDALGAPLVKFNQDTCLFVELGLPSVHFVRTVVEGVHFQVENS